MPIFFMAAWRLKLRRPIRSRWYQPQPPPISFFLFELHLGRELELFREMRVGQGSRLVGAERRPEDMPQSFVVASGLFLLTLLSIAATVALVLAAVGIFGVVFYSTSRRVREIGIRMALGARRGSVVALVLRTGMRPVVLGLTAGVFVAALLTRAMSGILFEVPPGDPLTFAGVVALVLMVSLAACALPARWATRVEAASALRTD